MAEETVITRETGNQTGNQSDKTNDTIAGESAIAAKRKEVSPYCSNPRSLYALGWNRYLRRKKRPTKHKRGFEQDWQLHLLQDGWDGAEDYCQHFGIELPLAGLPKDYRRVL